MSGRHAVTFLMGLCLSASWPALGQARPLPAGFESLLNRADSLRSMGRADAANRLLDSLEAAAVAREDARLRDAVHLNRAISAVIAQRLDDTERILLPLLPRLKAARDTLLWVRAMRTQARLLALRGRMKESAAAYRAATRTSREGGDRKEAAVTELLGGLTALEFGRYAEAEAALQRGLLDTRERGDPVLVMRLHAALARVFQNVGRAEEARAEHLAVLDAATRANNRVQLSETHYNLGSLEHASGDISKAEGHYLETLRLAREMAWTSRELAAANAIAILRVNAGRLADADSILAGALPRVYWPGTGIESRARILCQVGIVRREQGRNDEAIAWGRRAVTVGDSHTTRTALDVIRPLVASYEAAARYGEGLQLIDEQLQILDSRLVPETRDELELERARSLIRLGRSREALDILRRSIRPRPPGGVKGFDQIDRMSRIGDVHRQLGQRDSSFYWHRRAAETWEVWRRETEDASWREKMDNAGLDFAVRHAAARLDQRANDRVAVAEAFAALQRHRARTLAERMQDPARGRATPAAPADAARLRAALREGELFLDVHAGSETTLVIAVSRDTLAAWGAPGRGKFAKRLSSLRDLLADPANAMSPLRANAAASLGAELLGPGAGLIARSRTVVVAAGAMAQYPLGMLTVPGVAQPLAGRLSFTPSGTLLAAARARSRPGSGGLVAIARTRDESGRELRGAREEAQWLESRFSGARVHVDDDRVSKAAIGPLTSRAQVLHFAAHARDDARRPWRSGLLLGRAGAADAWLEAWDVVRLRPSARLCVLTGCQSFGGRGDYSETLEGLATAWLAAGVPTAIASQWDVDDRSAADFTRHFYDALARGQTVGASLRTAQDRLRALPATADPSHWAGFVALGDPETRVELRGR